jgi:hypothetical protein
MLQGQIGKMRAIWAMILVFKANFDIRNVRTTKEFTSLPDIFGGCILLVKAGNYGRL